MAMKDNKSITIAPEQREEAVTVFNSFGWELKTEQEINKDAQQFVSGSDDDYIYFKTIPAEHYVKLGFERDRGRQNYEELKSLENQYFAIKDPTIWEQPRFITKLWLIVIGVGLLLYVIPGVILLVIHIISYNKNTKLWNSAFARYQTDSASVEKQREEILSKAQALV